MLLQYILDIEEIETIMTIIVGEVAETANLHAAATWTAASLVEAEVAASQVEAVIGVQGVVVLAINQVEFSYSKFT